MKVKVTQQRPGKEQAVEDILYFELKWSSDEIDNKEVVAVATPVNEEVVPEGDEMEVDEAEDDSDNERADVDEDGYEADDEAEDDSDDDSDSSNNSNSSTITD